MPIHRRSSLPDPDLTVASFEDDDPAAGRSNDLQGLRLDVYTFIRRNPNCTRDDVSRGIDLKSSTTTARVKELIDLGYVTEPLGMRKETRAGVMARCLIVTDRLMSGRPNAKLEIEISLTIDCNGRYGASARVIGGLPQSGKPRTLKTKIVKLTAPPNAVAATAADTSKVKRVSRTDLQLAAGQIIDAEYEIVGR